MRNACANGLLVRLRLMAHGVCAMRVRDCMLKYIRGIREVNHGSAPVLLSLVVCTENVACRIGGGAFPVQATMLCLCPMLNMKGRNIMATIKTTEVKNVEVKEVTEVTMQERYADICATADAINSAYKDERIVDALNMTEHLTANLKEYNELLRREEYEKWLASESPVLSAIRQAVVTQVGMSVGVIKDTDIKQVKLNPEKLAQVDLMEFDAFARAVCEREVFAIGSKKVGLRLDRAAKFIGARIMRDVRSEDGRTCDKYVSDMLGEDGKDNLSNNSLKQFMQDCMDGILGEGYVFKTKDMRWILTVAASKKASGFKSANDIKKTVLPRKATLMNIMTASMYRIVNDGEYEADEK